MIRLALLSQMAAVRQFVKAKTEPARSMSINARDARRIDGAEVARSLPYCGVCATVFPTRQLISMKAIRESNQQGTFVRKAASFQLLTTIAGDENEICAPARENGRTFQLIAAQHAGDRVWIAASAHS